MKQDNNKRIYIGTQGWNYEGWTGPFYPRGTAKKEMLALYSKVFNTVEIDSTFYAIPASAAVQGWADRTPVDFKFSVKLPSEITHKNRLQGSEDCLKQFLDRIRLLGDKLGSILIQLPPDFSPSERKALSGFLKLLPADFNFALEFRDRAWLESDIQAELKSHNVALTLTDSKWIERDESFELIDKPTASFAYVRWLGPRELTDYSRVQIDRTVELEQWANAFKRLAKQVPLIFGYFNNHFQGHSPASTNQFKQMIGQKITSPQELVIQPSLF
jgi:uncharacterized protein YecE (DUF72 family)